MLCLSGSELYSRWVPLNLSRIQRQAEVCYTWNVLFFLAVETRILFICGSTSL